MEKKQKIQEKNSEVKEISQKGEQKVREVDNTKKR